MREAAYNLGLKLHLIPLTDEQIAKSESWAIRMRGTKEKRINYLKEGDEDGRHWCKLRKDAKRFKLASVDECARPTAFILRKPRKEQDKKLVIKKQSRAGMDVDQRAMSHLLDRLLGF